ncbi:MAG: glycosyltransferase family 4 protein [Phycisphaerales bacterium]|nr:glycosyltransferase family 4 protein [Phycisphaerales bacterium]
MGDSPHQSRPDQAAPSASTIRVCMQQPALPAYRVPVFAELAARPGLEVELLFNASKKLPNVDAQGFTARQVPERLLLRRPKEIRWVPAQLEAVDPARADVAVLEFNANVPSLLPAIRRAKRRGVGVVLWGHGYSVSERPITRRIRNWIASQADAVVLYHHEARERMINEGFDPERVFVALNCLDQTPIQVARDAWLGEPDRLAAFQAEHGLDRGPVVLFVSRFDPRNRLDLLVHAASRLSESHPDLVLAIVGDGEQREHLRDLARKWGIADRVVMPGAIYGEEALAPWFLSATAFCYPNFMGLSALHALGYGVPVVTSRDMSTHGPEARALTHGKTAQLVDLGEPGSLANALAELLDDPARAQDMGETGRALMLERYTIPNMVDGHEAAIRYAHACAQNR